MTKSHQYSSSTKAQNLFTKCLISQLYLNILFYFHLESHHSVKKGDIEVQQLEGERLRLSSPGEEIFVFASGPVFSSR